jgi:hypothetical protein
MNRCMARARRSHLAMLIMLLIVILGAGHLSPRANAVMFHAPIISQGQWDTRIGTTGMERPVFALATDNKHVYAGGDFTLAGGQPAAHMAYWDGHRWHPMGTGMEGSVFTMTLDGRGGLYVGGIFDTVIDRTHSYSVAYWNSTRWEAIRDAVGGVVHDLLLTDARLYVAGSYNSIVGGGRCCLVYWDGVDWWSVMPGPERRTSALAADGHGAIYVAGDFLNIGPIAASYIARWDRATRQWTPLGSGTNNTIAALVVDRHGYLYAGGTFSKAGGKPAYFIARWDGTHWEPLGLGTNGPVLALAVAPDGGLYAGGEFTAADGKSAQHIAYWNGQKWTALGHGTNGPVHALAVDARGVLTVGGNFTMAGGRPASRIAQWITDVPTMAPQQWLPIVGR